MPRITLTWSLGDRDGDLRAERAHLVVIRPLHDALS
jgi:hypothetical protein